MFLSSSVNRYGENRPISKQISGCCFPIKSRESFSLPLCMPSILCVWRVRGEMDLHLLLKPFDYPFSFQCHVSPRRPSLMIDNPLRNITSWLLSAALPPALLPLLHVLSISSSLSFSLSLSELWLISKLTCLSSTATFQPKWPALQYRSFSSPHDWLRLDFENG